MDQVGKITTVIQDHVQGLAIGEIDGLVNAPVVLIVGLSLPRVHRDTGGSDGGSGEILNLK
jgi:hypothetical protein